MGCSSACLGTSLPCRTRTRIPPADLLRVVWCCAAPPAPCAARPAPACSQRRQCQVPGAQRGGHCGRPACGVPGRHLQRPSLPVARGGGRQRQGAGLPLLHGGWWVPPCLAYSAVCTLLRCWCGGGSGRVVPGASGLGGGGGRGGCPQGMPMCSRPHPLPVLPQSASLFCTSGWHFRV